VPVAWTWPLFLAVPFGLETRSILVCQTYEDGIHQVYDHASTHKVLQSSMLSYTLCCGRIPDELLPVPTEILADWQPGAWLWLGPQGSSSFVRQCHFGTASEGQSCEPPYPLSIAI